MVVVVVLMVVVVVLMLLVVVLKVVVVVLMVVVAVLMVVVVVLMVVVVVLMVAVVPVSMASLVRYHRKVPLSTPHCHQSSGGAEWQVESEGEGRRMALFAGEQTMTSPLIRPPRAHLPTK